MADLPQKKHAGCKTTYREEFVEVVEDLFLKENSSLSGAVLAKTFRVSVATIYNWRKKHPLFRQAMDTGRDYKNIEVVESELLKACRGRWVTETTERFNKLGDLKSKDIRTKFIPGDVAAQKFFLMSRDARYSQVLEEATISGGKSVEFQIHIEKPNDKDDQKDVHSGADTSAVPSVGRSSTRH